MKLYLMRHGEAEPKRVDPARPLTEQARRDMDRVADCAARMGLDVGQIRHSVKTRAEQTAVLGKALAPL